jgi:hypothetical protein
MVTGSWTSEVPLDPEDRELLVPEPMEIDTSDPPPPRRVRTVQRPVYYISEVLHETKMRYLEVHKLLYAVPIASRKLRHYFQAHKISVVSSYPLRVMLYNSNATSNIAKWIAELAKFELDFVSCHAVKSQVLADFIVDWTPPANHPGGPDNSEPESRALDPTGLSSLMAPHISRGPVGGCYSSLYMGTSSSTWYTWTSKRPTT